jgi:hypothetical protein
MWGIIVRIRASVTLSLHTRSIAVNGVIWVKNDYWLSARTSLCFQPHFNMLYKCQGPPLPFSPLLTNKQSKREGLLLLILQYLGSIKVMKAMFKFLKLHVRNSSHRFIYPVIRSHSVTRCVVFFFASALIHKHTIISWVSQKDRWVLQLYICPMLPRSWVLYKFFGVLLSYTMWKF